MKRNFALQMTRFLYNLPSKVELVKAMLKMMEDKKVILFGVEKAILRQITDNVCDNDNTEELVAKFNAGEINVIASSKKLKQGITLDGVDTVILVSYYSKSHHLLQMLGRVVRFVEGKTGRLFILRTKDTFEENRWFDAMQKVLDVKGKVEKTIDLNIVQYIDGRNVIIKAKTHV
jgi:superfamily II DNA or RNA helicase